MMSEHTSLKLFIGELEDEKTLLQKYIEEKDFNNIAQVVLQGIGALQEIEKIGDNYLYDFDMNDLQEHLLNMQITSNLLKDFCLKDENYWMFFAGNYYSMCDRTIKKIHLENNEEWFKKRMTKIIKRNYVKEFLKILLDKGTVQHKDVCDFLDIQASELTRIVNPLCNIGCLEETKVGKYKMYSLSLLGKAYIKKYNVLEDYSGKIIFLKETNHKYSIISSIINTETNNPLGLGNIVDMDDYQIKPIAFQEDYIKPDVSFWKQRPKYYCSSSTQ